MKFDKYQALCTAILITAGFLIYSNTFNSPFVLDDKTTIKDNAFIRMTEISPGSIVDGAIGWAKTRPVSVLSFAFNYYFGRYDPQGYHFVNIVIHIINAILLFLFLKLTIGISGNLKFGDLKYGPFTVTTICFCIAFLWLVHPLHTQSVTYIVQRMSSMAAMFFILALLLYARGRLARQKASNKQYFWFSGCALAGILALGSKESAATLPFFIALYEWYFFQNLSKDWLKRSLKYVLGITVIFIFIALLYTGFHPFEKFTHLNDYSQNEFTISQRALTQFRVVIHYISLLLYPDPSRLNIDYDFPLSYSLINPLTTLLSSAIIIGLLALAVVLARRHRLISFAILWFFGNLAIESSIIPLAVIFEHRTYLPTMLAGLIPVLLALRYIKLNWLRIGLLCLVLALFSYWTYERNKVWQSKITLWQDGIKKSPNKARPYYNLGEAFANLDRIEEAVPQFLRSLEIKPDYAPAHNNLGVIFVKQGEIDRAIEHYQRALRLNPNSAESYSNLGLAFLKQGKTNEAIINYRKALQLNPHNAEMQFNLGDMLAKNGESEQAIEHLYSALEIKPDYAEAHNNLGGQLLKQGKPDKALKHFTAALNIDPDNPPAHNNMGIILIQKGKLGAAIQHFQTAARLDPDFQQAAANLSRALAIRRQMDSAAAKMQEALRNKPDDPLLNYDLGNLFLGMGELSKAINKFEKALSLQPDFPEALNNLALAYAAENQHDRALATFKKLIALQPDDAGTCYNIAVLYALQNIVDEAIVWLKKAIDNGYDNWELIINDNDLKNIRNSPAYRELVKGH